MSRESNQATIAQRLVGDFVVPGEGTGEVIAGGAIDIDTKGRIVAVGAESELGETRGPVTRVGGLLLPGLVNGHSHGPMTLVRSAGDGMALQRWLVEGVWPREARMTDSDVFHGMAVASCEMLLSGVTTSVEMYMFEESVAAAVTATGARVQIMAGLISVTIPDEAAFADRVSQIADLRSRLDGVDDAITVGFGPHSVYDLERWQLQRLVEVLASGPEARVHIHLEETQVERAQVIDAYGCTATQVLADVGMLEHPVVAAHGVWLDDTDMALLADAKASVVHCPQSNLKLGSGVAPVRFLRDAGVRLALGTDGVASNDNLDMWEDMRLAALLARGIAHDPAAMTAAQAFDLATRSGAQAIGVADIGELRPGAWADVVRLDLDHPAFTPGLEQDLFANLVWAAGAKHVTDVWVAGKQVVAEGEVTTIDRMATQAEARQSAQRLLAES